MKKEKYVVLLLVLLVQIALHSQVTANLPQDQIQCDVLNPGDNMEIFDLTSSIPEIIGDQTNVQVTFHLTSGDALGNGGVIPNPETYENIVNPQLIFVRVENVSNPNDSVITTLLIEVRIPPAPLNPNPDPLILLDEDNDGVAIFDLTIIVSELTNDPFVDIVTFFETEADAQNATNAIVSPETYTNIINPQTIYARIQNAPEAACVTIVPFTILADANLALTDPEINLVNLFPNPASEIIQIESPSFNKGVIYNIQGSQVMQFDNDSNTSVNSIVIDRLNPGLYFVKLDNYKTLTFIKN